MSAIDRYTTRRPSGSARALPVGVTGPILACLPACVLACAEPAPALQPLGTGAAPPDPGAGQVGGGGVAAGGMAGSALAGAGAAAGFGGTTALAGAAAGGPAAGSGGMTGVGGSAGMLAGTGAMAGSGGMTGLAGAGAPAGTGAPAGFGGTTGLAGIGGGLGGTGGPPPGGGQPNSSCGMGGPGPQSNGQLRRVDLMNQHADSYYLLGVPMQRSGPLPMVVAFHGDEGTPDNVAGWWKDVLDRHQDFILVAPRAPTPNGSWAYPGALRPDLLPDRTNWMVSVIEDVAGKYEVDVTRIHAIGYSGGSLFLGYRGFHLQDIFASIQWTCGGVNESEMEVYKPATRPDCKVAGRFVISMQDKVYLWPAAKNVEAMMMKNGHVTDFVETTCVGHCCYTSDYDEGAWQWFKTQQKCHKSTPRGCWPVNALP